VSAARNVNQFEKGAVCAVFTYVSYNLQVKTSAAVFFTELTSCRVNNPKKVLIESRIHCSQICGRDSSVGRATGYGLGGPGIESRWDVFRTRPDRPWGPPSVLHNGCRVFPGAKAAGAWR
jgi:hypothetical protein